MTEDGKPTDETDGTREKPDTKPEEAPKTTPLIDIANQAAERMEKANAETARLQDRQEAMDARKALGGRSEAGQAEMTDEEKLKKQGEEGAQEIVDAFR